MLYGQCQRQERRVYVRFFGRGAVFFGQRASHVARPVACVGISVAVFESQRVLGVRGDRCLPTLAPLIRPCLRCSCSSDPTAFGVSRVSILRCCAKFAAALSSVIAGSAAISKVVAAAGERLDRRGAWTGLPPVSLLIPLKNIFDPKIPKERV